MSTQNKKQIILNLYNLNKYGDKRKNEIKRKNDDQSNLIFLELLSLFPNIKTLTIQSTDNDGYDSFSFSLIALLNVICQSNLNEIIVKSKYCFEGNWINNLWQTDEQILKKEYAAKNYEIEMKQESDEYHFEINKL